MHFVEFDRKNENRVFTDSLTISIERLDAFPKECEAYLSDNFSFRSPLISIYQQVKYAMNSSPYPDKVILGKDGWLFNAGKEVEIYRGVLDFSDSELNAFKAEWANRKRYFDSTGIAFYWIICPVKHNVYPEKLPFSVRPSSKGRRTTQLIQYLDNGENSFIIDPTDMLQKEKERHKVFYQHDNHWNYRAGYLATEMLLERIRADFPNKIIPSADVVWYDSTLKDFGYQREVIGIDQLHEVTSFHRYRTERSFKTKNHGFTPPPTFPYPWEYERVFKSNENKNGLTVLIIRDSFGQLMMPFLKESFQETSFLFDDWEYDLNREIIEKVKPDIVIYQSVETHLEGVVGKKE